jgi:hypothetical protein
VANESAETAKLINSTLYPNPFVDKINISVDGNYNVIDIQVFNLLGQVVFSKQFVNNAPIEIPTQQFKSGQYSIRISVDGKRVLKRAVKN